MTLAGRPLAIAARLLGADLILAVVFAAAGMALFDDRAEFFRELQPATLISFAQLLLIAATARALHLRDTAGVAWWRSFWGLTAAVFAVFAFDEITQSAIFLGDLLEDVFELAPAGGFHDLEAVLLTLLFATAALVLLPRALVLLHHPRALVLLGLAVLLGAASQSLDSFAPATEWEFVFEETLKLCAGALFVGGFLTALHDVLARDATARPEAAETAAAGPAT